MGILKALVGLLARLRDTEPAALRGAIVAVAGVLAAIGFVLTSGQVEAIGGPVRRSQHLPHAERPVPSLLLDLLP